jgi:hypothetical protein
MGSVAGTELCRCAADPEPHSPQFFCRLLQFISLLQERKLPTHPSAHHRTRIVPQASTRRAHTAGSLHLFRVTESFLSGDHDAFAVLSGTAAGRSGSGAKSTSQVRRLSSPTSSKRPRQASRSASESALRVLSHE